MIPGVYSLSKNGTSNDLAIAGAATTVCTEVTKLNGLGSVTFQARLAYGNGGTDVKVYLQTSLDGGATWVDIACLAFAVASETKLVTLAAGATAAAVVPTDGALADDTMVQGVLGDRLRVKVVSTGTYGGSTVLSLRGAVR